MRGEAKRALLSEAGLDLDHPGPVPDTDGNFCPITGRMQVVTNPVDPDDTARAGRDCFTKQGKPVRYRAANLEALVVDALAGRAMRGTVDLWTSSALPLRSLAALSGPTEAPVVPRAALSWTGVKVVVARHGCLYYLAQPSGQVAVDCLAVPQMTQPAGWQRRRGPLGVAPAGQVSDFRVAEGIVHFGLGNQLVGVHAGTGQHLFTVDHGKPNNGVTVRLAGDRLLVISQRGQQQDLSVYDLAALNVTEPSRAQLPRPLHQAVLCGEQEAPAVRHPVWAEAYAEGFVVVAADGSLWVVPFDGEPRCRWRNSAGLCLVAAREFPGDPLVSLYEADGQPQVAFYGHRSDEDPVVWWLSLADEVVPQSQSLGRLQWASLHYPPCVIGGRLLQVAQRAAVGSQAHDRALDVHALALGSQAALTADVAIQATSTADLVGLQVAHTGGREVLLMRLREQQKGHFVVAYDPGGSERPPAQWRLFENLLGGEPTVLWDAAAVYAVTGLAETTQHTTVQAKVLP